MSQIKPCHPLQHPGTSRIARLVAALQPGYFRLDERSLQDLIVATHHYAQALRFFDNHDEHPAGAYWDRFWEVEVLTYLAVVAAKDTDDLCRRYDEADEALEKLLTAPPIQKGKKAPTHPLAAYLPLIELLRQMAWSLEETYQKLVQIKHPLQTRLLNSIRRDNCCDTDELESALRKLIAFHKAATPPPDKLAYIHYEGFFSHDERWGLRNRATFEAILPSGTVTREALRTLFATYFDAWLLLKADAQAAFDAELAHADLPEDVAKRAMEPHVALFIAFLRLFRHAQDSLNELGDNHLDYYYDHVLSLCRRPEMPDDVWLIFELARDADQFLLQKGDVFLAGKDKNGAPLLFEAIEDWVLRQATVADLRNTYIDLACGKINANPDVSKIYKGRLEKPNETTAHWRGMGDDNELPDGLLGWAFSSPQLILREGKRIIDVKMQVLEPVNADLSWIDQQDLLGVWLSTKGGWVRLEHRPDRIVTGTPTPDVERGAFNIFFENNTLHLRIVLERDDPPIEAFGPQAAAKAGFDTPWPLLRILINAERLQSCPPSPTPTTTGIYEALRQLLIGTVSIEVKASGIREKLIFQNDQGLYDGTQKVFPFGPAPEVGHKFYLGSTEVFQKALTCLRVCFDWIAPPEDFEKHYAAYRHTTLGPNNQVIAQINFPTPTPYLKIDFIDRADAPAPKQLARFGKRPANGLLSGTVTDMNNGAPIKDITVQLVGPNGVVSEVQTNVEGRYEFQSVSAGLSIRFIAPPQSDSDPDKSPLYEPLVLFAEKGASNAVPIEVGEFSVINAVLFPKSVVFGKFQQIEGEVVDIYGKPITSGVNLLLDNKALDLDASGKFAASLKGNQELSIGVDTDQYRQPNLDALQLNDFTHLRVVLEPAELTRETPGANAIDPKKPGISGQILANTNHTPRKGAYAVAQSPDLTISAFARDDGKYDLPLPSGNSPVQFLPNAYANAILNPTGMQPTMLAKDKIDAHVIAINQVEKDFHQSAVFVRVRDYKGDAVTAGLTFEVVRPGSSTVKTPILESGQFRLDITRGDREFRLKISLAGFEPQEFAIGSYSEFDVTLFPTNGYQTYGTPQASTISGSVYDANGAPLTGVSIEVMATATTPQINGNIFSLSATGVSKLVFKKTGYRNVEITGSNWSSRLDVVLSPETSAPTVSTSGISGVLKRADTQAAAGVHVTLEGVLAGGYIKYETRTNADGAFSITPLSGVNVRRLTFLEGDVFVEMDNPSDQTPLPPFARQVVKVRPARPSLRGKVLDAQDNPLQGVAVHLQSASGAIVAQTRTDVSGVYTLDAALQGASNTVEIWHPGYQPLRVNVEQGCMALDVRLLPKAVFFFVSGKVTDVLGAPLSKVAVAAADAQGIAVAETQTGAKGEYTLALPWDFAEVLHFQAPADFVKKVVSIPAEYPKPGLNFSKSALDVILFYQEINYVGLLDANSAIKRCFEVNINALNLVRDVRTQVFEKYSPTLKRGFLVFHLTETDFLHKAYPQALAYYALSAPKEAHLLNPPYTPAVNSISLEYCSVQVISGPENDGIDRFYHLLPFNGHKEVSLRVPMRRLVYPYNPHDQQDPESGPVAPIPYATGNLYIGLDKLVPGSALSLLFRIAAGTERAPEALPPRIVWSWLGPNNEWHPFGPGQVLRDETRGLTRSGMVQFAVPTAAVKGTTMLPGQRYWLRAAAVEEADAKRLASALPSLMGIDAQAVRARFVSRDNDLSHLAQPLPAGTIGSLLESRAEVRKVTQPLPSVGGRLPETTGTAFRTRISERLRHRDRAVTVWDFEHLLLERYPDVAVVRCIPHTCYRPTTVAAELAPGHITLAVVPRPALRNEPWEQPHFPKADLDDIRDFLATRANLFVAYGSDEEDTCLQVLNPHYEPLDIKVNVKFKPEYTDEAFYKQKLAEELRDFLSPWLNNPDVPPMFGRSIARSKFLRFLEGRYYVDYVYMDSLRIRRLRTDVAGQILDPAGKPISEKDLLTQTPAVEWILEKACPASARSIFVAGYIAVNEALPDVVKCSPTAQKPPTDKPNGTNPNPQAQPVTVVATATMRAETPPAASEPALARKTRTSKTNKP